MTLSYGFKLERIQVCNNVKAYSIEIKSCYNFEDILVLAVCLQYENLSQITFIAGCVENCTFV